MTERFFLPHSRAFVSCKPRITIGAALKPGTVIKVQKAIFGPYKRLHQPRPWITVALCFITCAVALAVAWLWVY